MDERTSKKPRGYHWYLVAGKDMRPFYVYMSGKDADELTKDNYVVVPCAAPWDRRQNEEE